MKTKIICPHCGFENNYELDITYSTKEMFAWCDLEEGGCDKKFAIQWHFVAVPSVFKLEAVPA